MRALEGKTSFIRIAMSRLQKVVLFACVFVILIHAMASFFPMERLWGINQFAYYSFTPRFIVVFLALVVLVPKINAILYKLFAGFFGLVDTKLKRVTRQYKYFLLSLGSIVLFWMLRAKTHLLGDGSLRGSEIALGTKFSVTEPLDFYLHALVYRFSNLDAYQTYILISCLAGGLFVFLALSLSYLLGQDNKQRVLAFVVLVSMGSVQLFFGYVESYSLVYAGVMAYFLLSFLYSKGRCGLFFPSLVLLLSISLHLSAVYLLPSLIYLHVVHSPKAARFLNFRKTLNVAFILLLVGAGLIVLSKTNPNPTGVTSYLIPLTGNENDPYSLFSGAHLLDMVNEQLLLSPIGLILWAIVILFARKIDFKDRAVTFLMIVTCFSFVFALVMDPKLGYARDWDLFSSTALGYTVLGIYLGLNYFRAAKIRSLDYMVLALVSVALFSTGPWIWVNAQEEKAVARFQALLEVDRERSAYGHEILALYYRDMGLLNEEMEEWKKALSVVETERYAGNLARAYERLGRYQEAIAMFKKTVQLDPNSVKTYVNLGNSYASLGDYEEAQRYYREAIDKDPYLLPAYTNLGGLLSRMGDYEEALKVLDSAIRINPDYFPAYNNIVAVYSRMGKPKDVIPLLRAYLKRNPEDFQRIKQLLTKMNIGLD